MNPLHPAITQKEKAAGALSARGLFLNPSGKLSGALHHRHRHRQSCAEPAPEPVQIEVQETNCAVKAMA